MTTTFTPVASTATPLAGGSGFGELRAGNLGVRLAISAEEIHAVQALRYRVFYHEMGAHPDPATLASKLDADLYDTVADHLLVVDHSLGEGSDNIVGTYRLIRRAAAARVGRFYSASEFDISMMEAFPGEVLELGRSCVALEYRSRAVMQLLWSGIAAYVFRHNIDVMFGCASLPGTDPDALGPELTYLYYHHLAPPEIRPRALPELYVDMRRVDPATLGDPRDFLVHAEVGVGEPGPGTRHAPSALQMGPGKIEGEVHALGHGGGRSRLGRVALQAMRQGAPVVENDRHAVSIRKIVTVRLR